MTGAIAALLQLDGLIFPCHLATIGVNGWSSIMRYTGDPGECIILAEHQESGGLLLPVHCLLLDGAGFTARVIVRTRSRGN